MNLHSEIMNIPVPHSVTHNLEHPDCKDMFSAHSYKIGHRDARHAAAELSLKAEARIEELETELQKSDKIAWDHFYIHQEVFNYLISQGYIDEVVEGDTWEAAAQNIINGIKNIEGKLK